MDRARRSDQNSRYVTDVHRVPSRANFGVKLSRPGFGPPAEPAASSPAWRRHGGCSSPLAARQFIGGNRRAALASARGTGRAAYTRDVGPTKVHGSRAADEHPLLTAAVATRHVKSHDVMWKMATWRSMRHSATNVTM